MEDHRGDWPSSRAEELLAVHPFTRTQPHELELRLIQIARMILFKPKLVLASSDFFVGISALDGRLLKLLMANLDETSFIATVEDYSLLSLFSNVVVFDRGSIVEQDELASLQKNEDSYLHKLINRRSE